MAADADDLSEERWRRRTEFRPKIRKPKRAKRPPPEIRASWKVIRFVHLLLFGRADDIAHTPLSIEQAAIQSGITTKYGRWLVADAPHFRALLQQEVNSILDGEFARLFRLRFEVPQAAKWSPIPPPPKVKTRFVATGDKPPKWLVGGLAAAIRARREARGEAAPRRPYDDDEDDAQINGTPDDWLKESL